MRNPVRESSSGFGRGFVSAIIFLGGLAAAFRVAEWVSSHPMPDAAIAWTMAPRFSVFDLFTIAMLLVIGYAVLWTVAFGPRMR